MEEWSLFDQGIEDRAVKNGAFDSSHTFKAKEVILNISYSSPHIFIVNKNGSFQSHKTDLY